MMQKRQRDEGGYGEHAGSTIAGVAGVELPCLACALRQERRRPGRSFAMGCLSPSSGKGLAGCSWLHDAARCMRRQWGDGGHLHRLLTILVPPGKTLKGTSAKPDKVICPCKLTPSMRAAHDVYCRAGMIAHAAPVSVHVG